MKRCFKCGETKPLAAFYPHPGMADGHLNKCVDCTKRDVKVHYHATRESRSEYERKRYRDPHRKALVAAYQRERRIRHPEKYAARNMIRDAVRRGTISPLPCEICGSTSKTQAHHDDYSKPLNVRWLCFKHHREVAHGQHVICSSF